MISITSPPVSTSAAGQGAKVKAALQDIATILLLTLALPFNAAIVLIALTAGAIKTLFNLLGFNSERENNSTVTSASAKTVLISGAKMTKALQLARSFHRAGHRVILIETHKYWLVGHRFSNAVDKFYTVPKPGSPDYAKSLLEIVEREQVDMYVPVCSPVASYYDSQAIPQLIDHCEVMHVDPEKIELLDDKYQFAKAAESFGLAVPKSYCITNPQQVIDFDFSGESRPYILKSIPYDSVRRLDLTKLPCETPEATAAFARSLPISEKTPWVMQEFIAGQEYCTHSTLRNGELRMHCCCESSAFQVNYENVDQPEIENWVRRFAAGLNLTGQASFDFMQANDNGKVYAIECNPRTHSAITMFYNQPMVAEAYLGNAPLPSPVQPLPESQPTYWTYHEVWRLLSGVFGLFDVFGGSGEKKSLSERKAAIAQTLNTLIKGKDAIFDWQDPLPFLMVHHWQIPLLLFDDLRQLKGWIRIDFNIGKLVQLGGD
ncbi:MAG: ATP-grasp enzyme [Cyanobacteria bacterium J06621_11]